MKTPFNPDIDFLSVNESAPPDFVDAYERLDARIAKYISHGMTVINQEAFLHISAKWEELVNQSIAEAAPMAVLNVGSFDNGKVYHDAVAVPLSLPAAMEAYLTELGIPELVHE